MIEWFKYSQWIKNNKDYSLLFEILHYNELIGNMLLITSAFLYFLLNTIVIIDLYLTMRNPFFPRRNRQPLYNTIIACSMILILIFAIFDVREFNLHELSNDSKHGKIQVHFVIITGIMAGSQFIPMLLVIKNLYQRGTSQNVKIQARRRHVIYMSLCLVMIYDLIKDQSLKNYLKIYEESHMD